MPGRLAEPGSQPEEERLPILPIKREPVVCVEHPCIIENLDRGIKSLGGNYAINKQFEGGQMPTTFEASLRPDDIMAKTITSRKARVDHLLLRITVPKRTGRVRRKGAVGPFFPADELDVESSGSRPRTRRALPAQTVIRSLRDNPEVAKTQVVGVIEECHRFRDLPDHQYATSTSTLMQNMRETILTSSMNQIKDFKYSMARGLADGQDVGPPPFFSIMKQPVPYNYRQNPYVKAVQDVDGRIQVMNVTAPVKHIRHNVDADTAQVPTLPPAELPPLETLSARMQETVRQLRLLFDKRPLMQRRVIVNLFPGTATEAELKGAVGYCGYAFKAGPYRDTLVKLGVDPRKDAKYRTYQTVAYQLSAEGKGAVDDPGSSMRIVSGKRVSVKKVKVPHSHIFDGTKFYKDGKVWQACDVTDPLLSEILEKAELRQEPDLNFSGWYGNATWSLFRRIMKYKIQQLESGKQPNDEMCRAVAAMFPCVIDDTNAHLTRADEPGSYISKSDYSDYTIDNEAAILASEVRSTAMAAFRFNRNQEQTKKQADGDVLMTDADAQADVTAGAARPGTPNDDLSDAALIGLDSESEDDQDQDGEEEVEDE